MKFLIHNSVFHIIKLTNSLRMELLKYEYVIVLYVYFILLTTHITSTQNITTFCTPLENSTEYYSSTLEYNSTVQASTTAKDTIPINITDNAQNRIVIPVFYTLESAIDVLQNAEGIYRIPAMKVLDALENKCPRNIPGRVRPRKPFIVIEGNHKTTRKIVARRIAKRLGATLMSHPPSCLEHLSEVFPRGTLIRKAFYAVSLYVAARSTKKIYDKYPVVMNGFWLENAAYALSRAFRFEKLPRIGAPVYKWPSDLLIPDLVFYVNFPDNLHYDTYTTRSKENWKPKMLEIFKRISRPSVLIVSTQMGVKAIVDFMATEIPRRCRGRRMS